MQFYYKLFYKAHNYWSVINSIPLINYRLKHKNAFII